MRRILFALVATAAIATACGGRNETDAPVAEEEAKPSVFSVSGTIKVVDRDGIELNFMDDLRVGDECTTTLGYGDISSGAQVTVRDADGTVVGVGTIGDGALTIDGFEMEGGGTANGVTEGCEFPFTIDGIPDDGDIYSVSVGMRPDYQFTRDEAGSLSLVLG